MASQVFDFFTVACLMGFDFAYLTMLHLHFLNDGAIHKVP